MLIFLRSIMGKNLSIEIEREDKLMRLKEIIHEKEGIPIERLTLFHAGKFLSEKKTISEFGIQKEAYIYFLERKFYIIEV